MAATNSDVLSLVVKFVADVQQLVSGMKEAETATVQSTAAMTDAVKKQTSAYEVLAEEQQRRVETMHLETGEEETSAAKRRQWYEEWIVIEHKKSEAARRSAEAEHERTAQEIQALEITRLAKAETAAYAENLRLQTQAVQDNTVAYERLSIRGLLPVLGNIRTLTRVATGIFAIGFLISEWATFADWIRTSVDNMMGFDEALNQTERDAVAASHASLVTVQGMSEAEKNHLTT